jgi:phosphohistidine phosphatase SixA
MKGNLMSANGSFTALILVRHASRQSLWNRQEEDHAIAGFDDQPPGDESDFTRTGFTRAYALAGRLADQLETENRTVAAIIHGKHLVTEQTAKIFADVLRRRKVSDREPLPWDALNPERKAPAPATIADQLAEKHIKGGVVILVGHQPGLTEIARLYLERRLPTGMLPIGSSEMACIDLQSKPRLRWLITAKSETLLQELQAKLASKFEVAKFFLGALVVGTGLSLNETIWQTTQPVGKVLAGCGAFCALASLGFTAATLFSYDRLVMPQDFWLGNSSGNGAPHWSVVRPPSQAHVIIYYEMINIWKTQFMPAIVLAFAALALFTVVLAHQSLTPSFPVALLSLILAGALAFVPGLVAYHRWKPRLGSPD